MSCLPSDLQGLLTEFAGFNCYDEQDSTHFFENSCEVYLLPSEPVLDELFTDRQGDHMAPYMGFPELQKYCDAIHDFRMPAQTVVGMQNTAYAMFRRYPILHHIYPCDCHTDFVMEETY